MKATQSQPIKYPVGEQSFESLRKENSLYIDKTAYIEKIISSGSKYYFLGRPRRFGKSLFLSTLQCFFEAKRDLFKDTYIDSTGWDWKKYPVLYLDLNIKKYKDDGYCFSNPNDTEPIYNPFSLINCLRFNKISDFWFETGTPTFLMGSWIDEGLNIQALDGTEA